MTNEAVPGGSDGGREVAFAALSKIANRQPPDARLSAQTLERVVAIAWRWQFSKVTRTEARKELREALKPEVKKQNEIKAQEEGR